MRVLAFDFGASSGRAVIAEYAEGVIKLSEVHRFSNDPVMLGGTYYWDILRLFHEVKQGILKAKLAGGFDSIGIDTWGVDFALLDKNGKLLRNPVHYRDRRTDGMIERVSELIPDELLYAKTGIQFISFNTIYQLFALKEQEPELYASADRLLFLPDLMGYFLTGKMTSEYSIATTSGLVNIADRDWDAEIFDRLSLRKDIMLPITKTGSVLGMLGDDICEELGVKSVPVISVCGHDTQSAVTAVPSTDDGFAFISCGTWSLFGTETDKPVISEETRKFNITNEGGYDYSVAFLKNISGLWLIQESRRQYKREGAEYSYADLEQAALKCEPFKCFIDPDDPALAVPGDLPGRIRAICERTGQYVPQTVGEVVRCIYESLAMKYRYVFDGISACTGKKYECLHVVGGGVKDGLLCRMTAASCDVPVLAGPAEATVLGNVAVQLISQGEISGIKQAREIIKRSQDTVLYQPENASVWAENLDRFKAVCGI